MLARRAGRALFGLGLTTGAVVLVSQALLHRNHLGAERIIEVTWIAAILAGVVAWAIARLVAHTWPSDELKYAGLVAPAIGLALIAPLTFHLLVLKLLRTADAFDDWVLISMVVAATAHIAFAAMSVVRVVRLTDGTHAATIKSVYMIVVLVSCIPFLLLPIVPVIVMITGVPMLPILKAPERIVARERAILGAAPQLAYARRLSGGR